MTAAQVGVAGEITCQLAQWHLQGTKGIKVKQVVIDTVGVDALLVELETGHGEGIGIGIVTNEEGPPRLDNGSQLPMKIHTEQLCQRHTGGQCQWSHLFEFVRKKWQKRALFHS